MNTKPYILSTDELTAETQILNLRPDSEECVEAQALEHLGYRVEPRTSSNEVRDFFVVDSDTGETIHSFKDYIWENACHFGLSCLGYSLFEYDDEDFIPHCEPDNILAFEL